MKIGILFPKDSGAIFDSSTTRTFGGATVQMFTIAEEIMRQRVHEVICFVPRIQGSARFSKWNFVQIFGRKIGILGEFLLLHNACRKQKIQVLIHHGLTPYSGALALYCKFFKIKFVFMLAHDNDTTFICQNKKRAELGNFLFKKSDVLVVQNKYQLREVQRRWGRSPLIIRIGFPILSNKDFRTEGRTILWIARCENWKQPELFIDLARKHPQHPFVMICPEVEKKYFSKIKVAASELKNLAFIDFVPFEKTWRYFENAQVFVNTSKSEGFPQTFVQAVVSGVPIVSLNVNPNNFISKHDCGVVCEGDVHRLAQEVDRIMNDDEKRAHLSRNALQYAKENHNIEKNINLLLKEIEK